jgi:hypothetical protein
LVVQPEHLCAQMCSLRPEKVRPRRIANFLSAGGLRVKISSRTAPRSKSAKTPRSTTRGKRKSSAASPSPRPEPPSPVPGKKLRLLCALAWPRDQEAHSRIAAATNLSCAPVHDYEHRKPCTYGALPIYECCRG